LSAIVFAGALAGAAVAQDAGPAPPAGQNSGSGNGGGYGQRDGHGGGMAVMGGESPTVPRGAPQQ